MTDSWHAYVDRTCATCGAGFSVQYQSTKRPNGGMYCSRQCRPGHNAHLQKLVVHPLGASRTVVSVTCATCAKSFQSKVKNIRRGGAKYCCRECNPNYRVAEPSSLVARRSNLKSKYGLTMAQFADLVRRQGNRCAICNEEQKPHFRRGILYVDHDHVTGQVRGLLCALCNLGIGYFGDRESVLRAAMDYLAMWSQPKKEAA